MTWWGEAALKDCWGKDCMSNGGCAVCGLICLWKKSGSRITRCSILCLWNHLNTQQCSPTETSVCWRGTRNWGTLFGAIETTFTLDIKLTNTHLHRSFVFNVNVYHWHVLQHQMTLLWSQVINGSSCDWWWKHNTWVDSLISNSFQVQCRDVCWK